MRRRDSLATVRAARRLDPAWFTRSLAAFSADHAEQSGLERGRQGLGGRSRTVVCCADVQVGHPADPVRLVHQLGLPPPEALRAAAAWSGDGNPTGQKAHPCLRSEWLATAPGGRGCGPRATSGCAAGTAAGHRSVSTALPHPAPGTACDRAHFYGDSRVAPAWRWGACHTCSATRRKLPPRTAAISAVL